MGLRREQWNTIVITIERPGLKFSVAVEMPQFFVSSRFTLCGFLFGIE
jgi:hypothetical protein